MKFRVPKPELPGFQLTPMLDVVFLLLCFFVTTSVYSQWENEVEIQLPSADSSVEPNRLPGEIIVNVAKNGDIRVNGRTLTPEELGEKCRALAAAFPGNPVVVRGDKEASWESVLRVLDVCAKNDLYNVNFASAVSGETGGDEPPPARVRQP
jgi:biopolymer transport protein ExbD